MSAPSISRASSMQSQSVKVQRHVLGIPVHALTTSTPARWPPDLVQKLWAFFRTDVAFADFAACNRVTRTTLLDLNIADLRVQLGCGGLDDFVTATGLNGQTVVDGKIRSKIYVEWPKYQSEERFSRQSSLATDVDRARSTVSPSPVPSSLGMGSRSRSQSRASTPPPAIVHIYNYGHSAVKPREAGLRASVENDSAVPETSLSFEGSQAEPHPTSFVHFARPDGTTVSAEKVGRGNFAMSSALLQARDALETTSKAAAGHAEGSTKLVSGRESGMPVFSNQAASKTHATYPDVSNLVETLDINTTPPSKPIQPQNTAAVRAVRPVADVTKVFSLFDIAWEGMSRATIRAEYGLALQVYGMLSKAYGASFAGMPRSKLVQDFQLLRSVLEVPSAGDEGADMKNEDEDGLETIDTGRSKSVSFVGKTSEE